MAAQAHTTPRGVCALASGASLLPTPAPRPAKAANDNTTSRAPCTWSRLIKVMATVGPEAEASVWSARKRGWTAQQYVDRMVAAYDGTRTPGLT